MIETNNLTGSSIDEEFLKRVAQIVLKGEDKKGDVSIVLVGPGRIKELNKKYRKKKKVTDVLTFGQSQKFPTVPENKLELGQVVICLREVKKNAKRFNSTFRKELAQVLVHGILHLLGYNHEEDGSGAKKMSEREEHYLSHIKSIRY